MKAWLLVLLAACHAHAGEPVAPCCPTSTGKYRNYSYGFTVVIPPGLKGLWNSIPCVPMPNDECMCMSDHGRAIELPAGGTIEIGAEHNNFSRNLATAVIHSIDSFKGGATGEDFAVTDVRMTRLGSLRAVRFREYVDEDGVRRHRECIVAVDARRAFVYEVHLDTAQPASPAARSALESLLRSWRLTPRR